jgi:hypothetical protein
MDYNSELKSVGALSSCYALVEISMYGTQVTDVSALKSLGVIVKYAPFMG